LFNEGNFSNHVFLKRLTMGCKARELMQLFSCWYQTDLY